MLIRAPITCPLTSGFLSFSLLGCPPSVAVFCVDQKWPSFRLQLLPALLPQAGSCVALGVLRKSVPVRVCVGPLTSSCGTALLSAPSVLTGPGEAQGEPPICWQTRQAQGPFRASTAVALEARIHTA